jgi:hypothetical protein
MKKRSLIAAAAMSLAVWAVPAWATPPSNVYYDRSPRHTDPWSDRAGPEDRRHDSRGHAASHEQAEESDDSAAVKKLAEQVKELTRQVKELNERLEGSKESPAKKAPARYSEGRYSEGRSSQGRSFQGRSFQGRSFQGRSSERQSSQGRSRGESGRDGYRRGEMGRMGPSGRGGGPMRPMPMGRMPMGRMPMGHDGHGRPPEGFDRMHGDHGRPGPMPMGRRFGGQDDDDHQFGRGSDSQREPSSQLESSGHESSGHESSGHESSRHESSGHESSGHAQPATRHRPETIGEKQITVDGGKMPELPDGLKLQPGDKVIIIIRGKDDDENTGHTRHETRIESDRESKDTKTDASPAKARKAEDDDDDHQQPARHERTQDRHRRSPDGN